MSAAADSDSAKSKTSKEGTKKDGVIFVYSGSKRDNIAGLLEWLPKKVDGVKRVEFIQLPYNVGDMNKVKFEKKRFTILCHSINNRRFSITDVTDALYDEFLEKASDKLKWKRVGIIANDFPADEMSSDAKYAARMESFRSTQPSAFKYSQFAFICGDLKEPDPDILRPEQWKQIQDGIQYSSLPRKTVAKKVQRK